MTNEKEQLLDIIHTLRPILEEQLRKTKDVDLVLNALISSIMNIVISQSRDDESCGRGVAGFLASCLMITDAWVNATREVMIKWDELESYRDEDHKIQ